MDSFGLGDWSGGEQLFCAAALGGDNAEPADRQSGQLSREARGFERLQARDRRGRPDPISHECQGAALAPVAAALAAVLTRENSVLDAATE